MNRNLLKYIIVICMLVILMYPTAASAKGKMPDGSKLGAIPVQGKTDDEIFLALDTEIKLWQKDDAVLMLESEYESIAIPRDVFSFQVEESLETLHEATKRSFTSLFMRQKNVAIPLVVTIDESAEPLQALKDKTYIDYQAVLANLRAAASELSVADLGIVYKDESKISLDTIAEAELALPTHSAAVLTYALEELEDIVIGSGDHFSVLESVQFPTKLTKSNKELDLIATTLYEMFLQADFDIVERHANLRVPSYASPGRDAKIDRKKGSDLIVVNRLHASVRLELTRNDETLRAKLLATPQEANYKIGIEKTDHIKPRTLYRYSHDLAPGEEVVLVAGQAGEKIIVYREQYRKGIFLADEKITEDFYAPRPKIVARSPEEAPEEPESDDRELETDEILEEVLKEEYETIDQLIDNIEDEIAKRETNEITDSNEDHSAENQNNSEQSNDTPVQDAPSDAAAITDIKEKQAELVERFAAMKEMIDLLYEGKDSSAEKKLKQEFESIHVKLEAIAERLAVLESGEVMK